MNIRNYIIPPLPDGTARSHVSIDCNVLQILELWRNVPSGMLDVVDSDGKVCGTLTSRGVALAMADIFALAPDSSLLRVSCPAADYSAALLARAVEDADAQLLGLWRVPTSDASLAEVVMMVGASDPSAAARSLRRFGFDVFPMAGAGDLDLETAIEHLSALKMYLEI